MSLINEYVKDLQRFMQKEIRCEFFQWRKYTAGRLDKVIFLDQFSRNMFRDSSLSFANDSLALALYQGNFS